MKHSRGLQLFFQWLCLVSIAVIPLNACALSEDANDQMITLYYTYTDTISANLSISGGTADCSGYVRSADNYDTKISVYLKQYKNNQWTTIASWSGSGDGGSDAGGTKNIGSGYKYKVVVVGKVYSSNNTLLETVSKETGVKNY